MKITVVGIGYVGLSLSLLLAQKNEVVAFDIDQKKIDLLNQRKTTMNDSEIITFLEAKDFNLLATTNIADAYKQSDLIIIATPTDYDDVSHSFNTESIENVIEDVLRLNSEALMVIKSTIPVGYIDSVKEKYSIDNILFSPEFLREGRALHDNLYPSRIVVGEKSERAKQVAETLREGAIKKDIPILLTNSVEAEAIKLFSNTYLAMRVAFFNELDTYSASNKLQVEDIIKGVCMDPRIGDHYNNPSFGYGGYCLPKDTKQLLANYKQVPQKLIKAIVESNKTRIKFIADEVLALKPKVIGVYRLAMKSGSDNFRSSSILGVIEHLLDKDIEVVVYEPAITDLGQFDVMMEDDIDVFKQNADVILTNRIYKELNDVQEKVYSRDVFGDS